MENKEIDTSELNQEESADYILTELKNSGVYSKNINKDYDAETVLIRFNYKAITYYILIYGYDETEFGIHSIDGSDLDQDDINDLVLAVNEKTEYIEDFIDLILNDEWYDLVKISKDVDKLLKKYENNEDWLDAILKAKRDFF